MTMMALYQDKLLPKEQLQISPDDRGYYFGDGIYEVIRVYGGKLFEAEAHFTRLQRSAEGVKIPLVESIASLQQRLNELVKVNTLQDGIIYMQITRGAAPRTHAFPPNAEPILTAYTSELPRPLANIKNGITAVLFEDIRWLRCDLKTLNLLPNVLAKQHAVDSGVGDVIFHRLGTVTESSSSNVFMVKEGVLHTHPANNLILHGVTRAVILRLARENGLTVVEQPFTTDELLRADEAFISSTTAEATPVISIDNKPIGAGEPGPVTRKIQQAFEAAIGL